MNDDIVTRLREHSWHVSVNQGVRATMHIAADEIERLRTDRDRWRNGLVRLAKIVDNHLFYFDADGEEYNDETACSIYNSFLSAHRDLYFEAVRSEL